MLQQVAYRCRRYMGELLGSRNYYSLDVRSKLAVCICNRAFGLEIDHVSDTSDDMMDAQLAALVDRKVVILDDADTFKTCRCLTDDLYSLLIREKSSLIYIDSHCYDYLIKHSQGPLQDVEMACGEWVKRPRKHCYTLHNYNFQSIGVRPMEVRYVFALEKCLHPKKAPLARGDGWAASST